MKIGVYKQKLRIPRKRRHAPACSGTAPCSRPATPRPARPLGGVFVQASKNNRNLLRHFYVALLFCQLDDETTSEKNYQFFSSRQQRHLSAAESMPRLKCASRVTRLGEFLLFDLLRTELHYLVGQTLGYFIHIKHFVLNLTKHELRWILGDFFGGH
jgi:hypothetical protein